MRKHKLKKNEVGISDTGATGNFLAPGAPVRNVKVADPPININLPNGAVVQSSHTCNMDIDGLPDTVTEAHIVPDLKQSLVSTRKFFDAGYRVEYTERDCRIYKKEKVILQGGRDKTSGLWMLPIKSHTSSKRPRQKHNSYRLRKQQHSAAATVYTLPYKQQQMKYMHQSFFNLPATTLIKAIINNQLINIPCMKVDTIRKYLSPSPATPKGRMKRPRTGIRSTRKPSPGSKALDHTSKGDVDSIYNPLEGNKVCNMFCYAALADKQTGTLYTDATGALPVRSLEGNQYYYVAYDYDHNYIFAEPIPDVKDDTIVKAMTKIFTLLEEKGFTPQLNIMDNQAARKIKEYLSTK